MRVSLLIRVDNVFVTDERNFFPTIKRNYQEKEVGHELTSDVECTGMILIIFITSMKTNFLSLKIFCSVPINHCCNHKATKFAYTKTSRKDMPLV